MPEFFVSITHTYGRTEYRVAIDARHAKSIIGGLKGRHPGRPIRVHRIGTTDDVTADFIAQRGA